MGIQTSIRLEIEPAKDRLCSDIAAVYRTLGTAITHRARMILFQNFTNSDLWISKNGVDDHIPLGARSFILLDVMSNQTAQGMSFYIAKGTQFYVKWLELAGPTAGSIYMTVFYGSEE
jgi:hypothetical protein